MKVVIAGGGEIGLRLAELLMTAHNVLYISPGEDERARLERLDVTPIRAAITSPAALHNAGVEDAGAFIAASREDEKNLVACIAARQLGARRVICFLNGHGFLSEVESDDSMAHSLGIDAVIRPSVQLANEITRIVTVPGAIDVQSYFNDQIHLAKFALDNESPLIGSQLSKLRFPADVLAIMVQRGDEILLTKGSTVFSADDRLTAIGKPIGIHRLQRQLIHSGRGKKHNRRAMIAGGGAVGTLVARGLLEDGWNVRIIETDKGRCTEIAGILDCLVIHGDATDLDLLREELGDPTDALIAVTSNDEKNLLISLLANYLKVPRVITRADRLINERIFEKVGVDVVLSANGTAIRHVVNRLIQEDDRHIGELEHGDFNVLDIQLPRNFRTQRIMDMKLPELAIIGAVLRGRDVEIPRGPFPLVAGDHLLAICHVDEEKDLHAALGLEYQAPLLP